jgi:hypothetical protein
VLNAAAAATSCLLVAAGVAMVSRPAGLVTAGLLGLAGTYVRAYVQARRR